MQYPSGQQFSTPQQQQEAQIHSDKSNLENLFRFFENPRENSFSVDFLFAEQPARNPAVDFFVLGEVAVKSAGGWFSL